LTHQKPSILVYGYGNPGRQDDGAGVMLAEKLDEWILDGKLEGVHTDTNYQLNLEDAATVSKYDLVIFADASREELNSFRMDPLPGSPRVEFTMHAVSPAFILHLCREVFGREPEAYLLHIRGYEWEFMGSMTEQAEENLIHALQFVKDFILQHRPGYDLNQLH
jgi:hydrogenase maturation protease